MSKWTAILSTAWILSSLVAATPAVTFSFNSQVPQVARKNEPYYFQFSSSTFEPQQGLTYSLSQQPAWLSLDTSNRTLLGTPGEADVGSSTFIITATDGTGAAHMQCTLVVAADPAPRLQGDFSQQLAAEANLTSNVPPTVSLTPGTHFDFHFRQDSFIDIVQRKLYYYATLANHTPLPSWLQFDSGSISFSGLAPQLSAFPQSFQVALIASDYQGFAGASVTFTLVIALRQLAIVPSFQTVPYTPGASVNFSLAQSVFLDGKQLAANDLRSATAILPGWASFDARSLLISGTAPQEGGVQNGSVAVVDTQGNTAEATLRFTSSNDSLFAGDIGTITATAGQDLEYVIPTSVLNDTTVALTLAVPPSADWLSLDPSAHVIHGLVPANASATVIQATLTAEAPTMSDVQTQAFKISITSGTMDSSSPTASASATAMAASSSSQGLSRGEIAAIVVCAIIGTAILLGIIICCCWLRRRRSRQHEYDRNTPSPQKRLISGPTLISKQPDMITVTTQVHSNVEKSHQMHAPGMDDENRPPQIAIEIPAPQVRSPRLGGRASGYSQASSIGNGEEAIRRDANIPEWGYESVALQRTHDSFSVPLEIARSSSRRMRSVSPNKRALHRAQQQRKAKRSIGLGIDTTGELANSHARSKSGRVAKKVSSAGLSATLDRSSCASLSTQATSLLSTKPSDFPRPPTQSTFSDGSRSRTTLSMIDPDKRRSIRLLRRSDSITDSRPIELRRESFIRARASSSLQSPLFSHGSRNPLEARARGSSSEASLNILNRWRSRRRVQRPTYSQTSFEISDSDCRRLSQRVRSAFAPNFPRVISGSEYEEVEYANAVEDDKDEEWEDITPIQSRHQSSSNMQDLAAEMAKPRHQRSWVLPGEASPTPPPPSRSGEASSGRRGLSDSEARTRWKSRVARSSSQLSQSTVSGTIEEAPSPAIPKKSPKRRFSNAHEPVGLLNKTSLRRLKDNERPRLGDTKSSRPVSVERVESERLSSLKAETMDAQAGSETLLEDDEELDAALLGPDRALRVIGGTQKSAMSAKAFL